MKTILWVEDEASFRYIVSRRLEDEGYDVVESVGSMEALKIIESDRKIDLILLDIRMPQGQPHGIATGLMARRKRPNVPILFLTAYSDLAGIQPPIGEVIEKSSELAGLVSTIAKMLGSPDPIAA
ncbi:MAG TPA: response regulator [Aliidongia sp.]|nr:response regulator [Aliidongia sp.]